MDFPISNEALALTRRSRQVVTEIVAAVCIFVVDHCGSICTYCRYQTSACIPVPYRPFNLSRTPKYLARFWGQSGESPNTVNPGSISHQFTNRGVPSLPRLVNYDFLSVTMVPHSFTPAMIFYVFVCHITLITVFFSG